MWDIVWGEIRKIKWPDDPNISASLRFYWEALWKQTKLYINLSQQNFILPYVGVFLMYKIFSNYKHFCTKCERIVYIKVI